ncbi:nucleotidyltransferase domain-containing protein [Sporohalobacter salinus]|uniref:nucleotidyltransferase domain-containing protein n=1 Tax=Sporohalobacter salinus TaxID=1494606 RepID=UPI00195F4AFF|nr:putative nucleotidyltransferase [Sporohalobacter salinus]
MDLDIHHEKIKDICEKEDIELMGVFGSVARGEEKDNSDIDIIIKYKNSDKSLFDLVRLEKRLTKLFGRKVDLLTENSINSCIIDNIKQDLRLLYS